MKKRNRALIGNFPPYGVIDNAHSGDLNAGGPKAWKISAAGDWAAFREATVELLANTLWPRYHLAEQRWEGDATEIMTELTSADLSILMDMRVYANPLPLDTAPVVPNYPAGCPKHRALFTQEDNFGFFSSYRCYDATLQPASNDFPKIFNQGMSDKCGPASIQFKQELQRPRAYQTALLFGLDYNLEDAISSLTPSMSSGHCLQGMLGGGAIMESLLLSGAAVGPESWNALRQYTVDIGDRRVMAGVHYPADNLCSWIIALRMANVVLDARVKPLLCQAIFENSMVYRRILASKNPVYTPALQLLQSSALEVEEELAKRATP